MTGNLTMFSANKPFVFESHPVSVQIGGEHLCAWLQSRSGSDRVVAKWLNDKQLEVLSSAQSTAGPPQIAVDTTNWHMDCLGKLLRIPAESLTNGSQFKLRG